MEKLKLLSSLTGSVKLCVDFFGLLTGNSWARCFREIACKSQGGRLKLWSG